MMTLIQSILNKSSKSNNAFYLNNYKEFQKAENKNESASKLKNQYSLGNFYKKKEIKNPKWNPLGDFQIYRVNINLKDF